jgi:sulfur carrier protein
MSEVRRADPVHASVNGDDHEFEAGTTIAAVVARWCASDRGVAVAVGRQVVPRSEWSTVVVAEGDQIEVVTAAAGG